MAILYKRGGKVKGKKAKAAKYKSRNPFTDFDDSMNHRSDEYQMDRIPFIKTR